MNTYYRMDQLTLVPPLQNEIQQLRQAAASRLKCAPEQFLDLRILKKSLDARKKPELKYVYSVTFALRDIKKAEALLHKKGKSGAMLKRCEPDDHTLPEVNAAIRHPQQRPIIVGSGPAGLFCAYVLAKAGLCPRILERGKDVDARTADVEAFWKGGKLKPDTNVQFGEGGAGTFSDGKLNTQVSGKGGLHAEVLRLFAEYGADAQILYPNKPHIGTDVLKQVVKNMRLDLERMGVEYFFETTFLKPQIRNGKLRGAVLRHADKTAEEWEADTMVLCTGHSARDTFLHLYEAGLAMEQKAFAVGYRVQHLQTRIDLAQYGSGYETKGLPAADYKLTARTASGRGVYSFCMCPGGYVVNASSEAGRLAVNGMSYHDRGAANANAAIVVTVDGSVFGHGLFDGMHFQEQIEERAFLAAQGKIPIERLADLSVHKTEGLAEGIAPQIRGEWQYAPLDGILPQALETDILEAFPVFGRQIQGFDDGDTLLAGVESRTSSPLRILRDENGQSSVEGIFPCGEGAGYAGGITSAAIDGMRSAEQVIGYICNRA